MKKIIALTSFLLMLTSIAQEEVKLKNLKKILEHDKLLEISKEKEKLEKLKKKVKKKVIRKISRFPSEDVFWEIFSEYWLAHNAAELKWNYNYPDYGIGNFFKKTAIKLGFVQKDFKILYSKSPLVTHFALPSKKDSYIFVLGIPFIQRMDLTKIEITTLLLEDMIRSDKGYIQSIISKNTSLEKLYGIELTSSMDSTNKVMKNLNSNLNDFFSKKGFSFQMQFDVTMKMNSYLLSTPEILNSYKSLCKKRYYLGLNHKEFKFYARVYPSPEMQRKWLKITL